jgi:sugar lactone lactonase YvrE
VSVEVLVNRGCVLAEGPVWDDREGCLYWVDITPGVLHRTDPTSGETTAYSVGAPLGAACLRSQGGLLLAMSTGFAYFDPGNGAPRPIIDPEAGNDLNRFNDGKCDPAGRFWAGTMAFSEAEGAGSLYCLTPDLKVSKKLSGVTISNGLAWTKDHRTMYYIDTIPLKVYAFDYDEGTGEISNQRVAITIKAEQGYPDGMTIDVEDKLWIAHYGGSCVRRWDPLTGAILETIPLPVSQVTCPTFGGPNLDTLYITTAAQNLTGEALAREPLAGALFNVKVGVPGFPAFRFAG